MSRRRKKGLHPLVAAGLLVAGASVAGKAAWDAANGPSAAPARDVEIVDVPEMDSGTNSGDQPSAIRWRDLLAVHGSFDGRVPVRVAFSVLEEVRNALPAPAGETAGLAVHWEGPDPPELQLGVVMISAGSRRAVLGGRVVGIGDEVAGVVLREITRDRVVTLWGARVLTYDLENGWPREFRAELERRRRETGEQPGSEITDPEAGTRDASWQGRFK